MFNNLFNHVNNHLSSKQKKKLVFLSIVSVFISIIEIFSLAMILPFIALLSDKTFIEKHNFVKQIYSTYFSSFDQFVYTFGVFLILLYFLRGIVNILYQYQMTSFSNDVVSETRTKLFSTDLFLDYTTFSSVNSSKLMTNITTESNQIYHIIYPTLTIISEANVFILMILLILSQSFNVSLILLIFFVFLSFLILFIFKKYFLLAGEKRNIFTEKMQRIINESLGNFKYIKLSNIEKTITTKFEMISNELAKTNTIYLVLSVMPKFIFETFGLIIVVITSMYLYGSGSDIVTTIGLYVVAFYRLLPSVNKIISSVNSLKYYEKAFVSISENKQLSVEKPHGISPLTFNEIIKLENISFSYQNKVVFNNLNLTILKSDKIAFVGSSGGGKSTLANIVTSLISNYIGNIYIDNILLGDSNMAFWRKKIGYIPQDIYLFDASVRDNIVFGSEICDDDRVIEVLKIAKIFDYLLLQDGLDTVVGDNAIQLSGGQKQRIALARALYKDPDILVLDEATSALDAQTESEIMDDIYSICKDKTLMIVAHRLSTISKCNRIIEIKNGELFEKQL